MSVASVIVPVTERVAVADYSGLVRAALAQPQVRELIVAGRLAEADRGALAALGARSLSVVGGLTDRPVIAVPTSVGYGAHFGGLTPLLAMLNSCASGVTVVNIDNGFSAGYAAALIARLAAAPAAEAGERRD